MKDRINQWMRGHLPLKYRSLGRARTTLFGHHSAFRFQHTRVPVPVGAGSKIQDLAREWPCCGMSYYRLDLDGLTFPGGESWSGRWDALRRATNYEGKTIVELGCNQAILSSWLLKYCGARAAIGTDLDERILRTAAAVAACLGVEPKLLLLDFDGPEPWEERLAVFHPDIVIALNIFHHVKEKERFLSFLGRFDEILYEGADPLDIEKERLATQGFDRIEIVDDQSKRPVLRATKSGK